MYKSEQIKCCQGRLKRASHRFFFGTFMLMAVFVLVNSCSNEKQDVQLRLTHAENKLIEKTYKSRLDSLRPLWDSLCVLNHDEMLTHALDSIVKQRLAEEALLRSRPVK